MLPWPKARETRFVLCTRVLALYFAFEMLHLLFACGASEDILTNTAMAKIRGGVNFLANEDEQVVVEVVEREETISLRPRTF